MAFFIKRWRNSSRAPRHASGLSWFFAEFKEFIIFLKQYIQEKGYGFSSQFEKRKNTVVKSVLIKRGRSNRIFLHISVLVILTVGIIASPFISDSNPFSQNKNSLTFAQEVATTPADLQSDDVFQTHIDNVRTKTISYTVQNGDTVSTIAKKFGISEDTIRWANNLTDDSINVGDDLQILPVTGISHKVESGDTIYTIAKTYGVDAQPIADFPGNDFANPQTFSLVVGEEIIVPGGVKPEEKATPQYSAPTEGLQYYAQIPEGSSPTAGGFVWPAHGTFNQGFSWYHPGIDIGMPIGTPLVAAQTGVVAATYPTGYNTGYGTYIVIKGDNGFSTAYAHLSAIVVSPGQRVSAGSTLIGYSGLTGRTTGPHLHFEIRAPGGNVNPMSYLP